MDDWKETKNTNIMAVYRQVNNVDNGMISLEVKVILTDCLRMNKNNQWEASTLGGKKKIWAEDSVCSCGSRKFGMEAIVKHTIEENCSEMNYLKVWRLKRLQLT